MSRRSVRKALAFCFAAVAVALSPSLLRPDALLITWPMLASTISEIFIEQDSVVVELEIAASAPFVARARTTSGDLLTEATNEPLDGNGIFRSRAAWNVHGSVGHWGHVHQRVNRYDADITVEVIDGAWKITELDVLQEERIPTTPAGAAP